MAMAEQPESFRVLIGYDGSDSARGAVRDLRHAGLPATGEATVVTASAVPRETSFGAVTGRDPLVGGLLPGEALLAIETARAEERARAVAAEGAEMVTGALLGWRTRSESRPGPAYWALAEAARAWPADLVVVGAHGRSPLGRLVLGSVSQNVLAHAPCSVRVGRPRALNDRSPDAPLRLLLAIDGSPESARAAEAVRARNWPPRTEVRIAIVVDLGLSLALARLQLGVGAGTDDLDSPVQRVVRAVGEQFHGCDLAVSVAVLEGDPKRVLVREAERWGCDCVFLGAQGHSRLERVLIGSVSAAVAARASCSVEVIREPSR